MRRMHNPPLMSLVAGAVLAGAALARQPAPIADECEPSWAEGVFLGPPGVSGYVKALEVFDDGTGPALYAGGSFLRAQGLEANHIAKWDGSSWSALSGGLDGPVSALAVFDDGSGPALYVGGAFTAADQSIANNIARWDGAAWTPLGIGTDGAVSSLAVFDDGAGEGPALFAAGFFMNAGGAPASLIAKWNGTSWSALSADFNVSIRALAVFDDGAGDGPALYAGGHFTTVGGSSILRIAKWNGVKWSSVGSGMNDEVRALTVFDDGSGPALYAGGEFTYSGLLPINYIARWDGNSWSPLAAGLNLSVHAMAAADNGTGSVLYVGGIFSRAGGVNASHIAKWDGAQWSPVAGGLYSDVVALKEFDDGTGPTIFAGGSFPQAHPGGIRTNYIAKLDGDDWSPLGGGINGWILAMAEFDDGSGKATYVAGDFVAAADNQLLRIARWSGSEWHSVGSGVQGSSVRALQVFDDGAGSGLYAAGSFSGAGGVQVANIARWDGASWSALGSGTNGAVLALAEFDDGVGPALYVGGVFTSAGGLAANRVAKWNGSAWAALGVGTDSDVSALTVFDNGSGPALYAGGKFIKAGGVSVNRVAKWSGTAWSPLGAGLKLEVFTLAQYDDGSGPALYAGGRSVTSGLGVAANRIAKWNGAVWSEVGAGLGGESSITTARSMAVFDDGAGPKLHVGGNFVTAGGVSANSIAKWDGAQWAPLEEGVDNTVTSLLATSGADGPSLYVGGGFSRAGGTASGNIAKWQGCADAPAICLGDANDDGLVSLNDIDAVLANWLSDYGVGSGLGDANRDGFVNFRDIETVLTLWGVECD